MIGSDLAYGQMRSNWAHTDCQHVYLNDRLFDQLQIDVSNVIAHRKSSITGQSDCMSFH